MKTLIKNLIPVNSKVYKMMENAYRYRYWHPRSWPNNILIDYANYKSKVNFIQIGSNNGITADPITEFITGKNWSGTLIEPVPYLYNQLVKNYSHCKDRLIFENSAIANVSGDLKFYRLKESKDPSLPFWYDQLGSFNKEVVMKHRDSIPGFDNLFIEDTVSAITFSELIKKHSFKDIDFIQIDTEGFDYEILKLIPFESIDIEFIMFENRHLSDADYRQAIRLLKSYGFAVGSLYKDTIAVKKEILPQLLPASQHPAINETEPKLAGL
jgi:FkbM family methyltransferase